MALFFSACWQLPPHPMLIRNEAEVPRISLEAAKEHFDAGTALFVDTRSESLYRRQHIRGALNLPLGHGQTLARDLPKDRLIIAYCT